MTWAEGLSADERDRLARAWIDMGLAEHASVAAFARFILHLMSLGAPPGLLTGAARAIDDEINHARLCFGLARRLLAEPAAPGPMDLSGVLVPTEPEEILRGAILEGCFGETMAASCVRVALEEAAHPSIREVLAIIVEDETRHAELSWQFVTWMLETYPALAPAAERVFNEAIGRHQSLPALDNEFTPAGYGFLAPQTRRAVELATLRDLILPRAAELFPPRVAAGQRQDR